MRDPSWRKGRAIHASLYMSEAYEKDEMSVQLSSTLDCCLQKRREPYMGRGTKPIVISRLSIFSKVSC